MRSRLPWLLLTVATVAALALVEPYLGLDRSSSRVGVGGSMAYAVLVVHIFTAAVALTLGPLQFVATIRRRRNIHLAIGRVYLLAGVLPSAVTAVPVAVWSRRPVTQIGLTSAALLWLVSAGLAYRAARRRDFPSHRDWMLRNYALTFLAVTARVLTPVLVLVQLPFGGVDPGSFDRLIPIGQTTGWIVNLAVAEGLIRRRQRHRSVAAAA